ncbi:VOC family protein [Amycolatopsis sp. NPDC004079]|uniref:VOC family protein n=1 Tax=Amycolatopsis sp. NPDC004079 TaxID=3154549 RepID=UPI0033B2406D
MPALDGNTHINLTVSDLDRSVPWYCEVFGFVSVNDVSPDGSGFRFCTLVHPASLASVVLGATEDGDTSPFDESRTGLHHLAFHVPDREALTGWAEHLDRAGVARSEITESPFETGVQIWLRDPDNIWLELYWVNRAFFADGLRRAWRAARRAGIERPWTAAGQR